MDDDRINQEKHNCKSEKKGIKLFVFVACNPYFLTLLLPLQYWIGLRVPMLLPSELQDTYKL